MAFNGKSFFRIPRPILRPGFLNAETLADNKTLVVKDSQFQSLDPDGVSRDCILPAEKDGLRFDIKNSASSGGFDIVVKNDGGSTIVTLTDGLSSVVVCDGTNWVAFQGQ
jgi:hypothetical protein